MADGPPEKRRCTKDGKNGDAGKEKYEIKDDKTEVGRKDESDLEETGKNDADNDDSVLLSQAMDDEDWVAPTQPVKASFLPDNLRESLLKPLDGVPFDGNVYMLTQEINRLRKHLGDSLGEKQMLMYKVKNLNRENAVLQDNLIQMQQTFEQRFVEQKNDFEKTERAMRNVITYQEQDLRTKEFRDRLNTSASVAASHIEETEISSSARNESSVIRLKKVFIPSSRRGNSFPTSLNDSPMLKKAFDHCKSVLNDTFRAIGSQGKSIENATINQDDDVCGRSNRIKQTFSCLGMQNSDPASYNCAVYLRSDNQLFQLCGTRDEMITMNFRSVVPEVLRNHKWKNIRHVQCVLAEPRKRWCR